MNNELTQKLSNGWKTHKKPLMYGLLVLLAVFALGRCTAGPRHETAPAAVQSGETKTQWWTCSMHPQIRLPHPGKCPICGMTLIPLETGSGADNPREISVSPSAAKLMQIETSPVERKFVQAEVRMVGKVNFDETRTAFITARMPGRLDRLFVDYTGVQVKKGDHMASIYSPELLSAQQELFQALDSVKALKNSESSIVRDVSQSTVESVREKLRLWGLTPEQIQEIETRGTLMDHITLYSPVGGIVIHKNAQEGSYVKTGDRIYTVADLSRVWVQMDAYESDLPWLRYGQKVTFTTEAWPGEIFEGTIAFIDPVLNASTRTVNVRVNVNNPEMKLKPGLFVRAVAHPLVAENGQVMSAALAGKWISPMHPEIIKDHPGTCDICGMPLVTAESLGYVSEKPENAPLVIPVTAALKTGKRAIVYVQLPNTDHPTYEGREVLLGARLGDFYVVKRGLSVGERVVTHGEFKLDAELQIQAKPSMMTPEGGGGGGMAGMDMGEKPKPVGGMEKADAPPMPSLPMASRMQLQAVQTAAQAALDDLANWTPGAAFSSFQTLADTISAMESAALPPAMQPLWKEAAMLLGNDAAEGRMILTQSDASTLGDELREHLQAFTKNMGLGGKPMAMAPALQPMEIPAAFSEQLETAVQAYFAIQQALGADSADASKTAAGDMQEKLHLVDMGLLKGDGHRTWMDHLKNLNAAVAKLEAATTIEQQRVAFQPLSQQLTLTLQVFPITHPAYQAFCPMAFGGTGATWLQSGKEILNPYLGTAMPGCGEIQKTIGASK